MVSRWHVNLPNVGKVLHSWHVRLRQFEDCVVFGDQTVNCGVAEADYPYKLLVH